jgi:beta-N-acetylhexosaminidase
MARPFSFVSAGAVLAVLLTASCTSSGPTGSPPRTPTWGQPPSSSPPRRPAAGPVLPPPDAPPVEEPAPVPLAPLPVLPTPAEVAMAGFGLDAFAPPDTSGGAAWAEATLDRLGRDAQIGQLVVAGIPAGSRWRAVRVEMLALARSGVGGFLIPRTWKPDEVREAAAALQAAAPVPLLLAADYERGAGRADSPELTELPAAMAFGAAADEALAAAAGRLVALESRAVGVHWLFGPVVDVNRNPDNPIINTRAYGERAADVTRLAGAFVREAERFGLLTTLKHFPGHGDTGVDSHSRLAVVDAPLAVLDTSDLAPYRVLMRASVPPSAVMAAHVWARPLDPVRRPATLSSPVLVDLLRRRLGFTGLVVTDDVQMGALAGLSEAERAVRPLVAGADVVLTPRSAPAALAAIRAAVEAGTLSAQDVRDRAARVLAAKARAGLHRAAGPDDVLWRRLTAPGRPHALADTVALRAATRVYETPGVLPLRGRVALVQIANVRAVGTLGRALDAFRDALRPSVERRFDGTPLPSQIAALEALDADVVVVALHQRLVSGRGTAGLREGQAQLVAALRGSGRRLVFVSFGSPYTLSDLNGGDAAFAFYDSTLPSVRAASEVLFGRAEAAGRLPVTLR